MRVVTQDYRNDKIEVGKVPIPSFGRGRILVGAAVSLVSAGTERSMVELAEGNLLALALDRPDLVPRVIGKLRQGSLFFV